MIVPTMRALSRRASTLSHPLVARLVVDSGLWFAAVPIAALMRYEFALARVPWAAAFVVGFVGVALQICTALVVRMHYGRSRFASFGDTVTTGAATALTAGILFILNVVVFGRILPGSVPLVAGGLTIGGQWIVRVKWRVSSGRARRPDSAKAEPVIVFGAGEAGTQLVTSMLRDRTSPYLPVALLDDDPRKMQLRVLGVRVVGTMAVLEATAKRTGAKLLVLAIPRAGAALVRDTVRRATEAGLDLRVVPSVAELVGSALTVAHIRPVQEADLLGRHEIDTDVEAIAGYLTGRRVLVTGAGGSIGAELCRQVHRFAPAALIMLDHDESGLHDLQLSIHGRAHLDDPNLLVADIRDRERLFEVFAAARPDVVFHAAALKHVALLEMHPVEAVKTNVFGTQNVLDAAESVDVSRFVNISTDKAAKPINVLGRSKRLAERLTASVSPANGVYLSVRFGNVLGSRGSVLVTFRAQIESGGPVTVTDPDVTRYFMTVEEAVQLVIQAGAIGSAGEVLVLDMGAPVRIADVAERLVEAARRRVRIVYTGLRAGEKLHEDLFDDDEVDQRPHHAQISEVAAPPLSIVDVRAFGDDTAIAHGLAELLDTPSPILSGSR